MSICKGEQSWTEKTNDLFITNFNFKDEFLFENIVKFQFVFVRSLIIFVLNAQHDAHFLNGVYTNGLNSVILAFKRLVFLDPVIAESDVNKFNVLTYKLRRTVFIFAVIIMEVK